MAVEFSLDIDIKVDKNLIESFGALESQVVQWGGAALFEVGSDILIKSKELVPVDRGHLRSSGTVHAPRMEQGRMVVYISYGGPAVNYAVIQHETPPDIFRHSEGRQWKYLEQPVLESAGEIESRLERLLSERIARELG